MSAWDDMASVCKTGELFDQCVEAVTNVITLYGEAGKSDRIPKKYVFLADLFHQAEKFKVSVYACLLHWNRMNFN